MPGTAGIIQQQQHTSGNNPQVCPVCVQSWVYSSSLPLQSFRTSSSSSVTPSMSLALPARPAPAAAAPA